MIKMVIRWNKFSKQVLQGERKVLLYAYCIGLERKIQINKIITINAFINAFLVLDQQSLPKQSHHKVDLVGVLGLLIKNELPNNLIF